MQKIDYEGDERTETPNGDIGGNPKIDIKRKSSSPMTEGKRKKAVFSVSVEARTISICFRNKEKRGMKILKG